MNQMYRIPTQIVLGKTCILNNAELIRSMGDKAFIVTGRSSAKINGSLDDVIRVLESNGQIYEIFDRVMSNPTVDCIISGAELARNCSADFVIGIGGGSPMDAAKAIAVLATQDIPRENLFNGKFKPKRLPLMMVPTTAGTGSEVTQYAIMTNDELKTKTSMAAPFMIPDIAFLDATYLEKLPLSVTANTAIDALTHCIEGYLSCRTNPFTDAWALEGIRLITSVFPTISSNTVGDAERENLLYASCMGGMVIAHTGTTAVHSMGYSLTYYKHIDHGRANGLLITAFLNFIKPYDSEKIGHLLDASGCDDLNTFGLMIDGLLGENEKVTADEAALYASSAIKAWNIKNCNAVMTERDLYNIICKSFEIEV